MNLNTLLRTTQVSWGINVDRERFYSNNQTLTHGEDLSQDIGRECEVIKIWMGSSKSWMAMYNVVIYVS